MTQDWQDKLQKPCKKQNVIAILIKQDSKETRVYIGTNWCEQPQRICPRLGLESGKAYWMCQEICGQSGHAEVDACKQAGEDARGSIVYVTGHKYICEACQRVMQGYGVEKWHLL